MNFKFLPIGSVVLLRESFKKVMVMGFCQANPENLNTIYDYCGCLYPEGYIDSQKVYLFNNDMIEKVYSVGYMDAEQFEFDEKLNDIMDKVRRAENGDIDEDYGDIDEDYGDINDIDNHKNKMQEEGEEIFENIDEDD